jgi:hypothetical protein
VPKLQEEVASEVQEHEQAAKVPPVVFEAQQRSSCCCLQRLRTSVLQFVYKEQQEKGDSGQTEISS